MICANGLHEREPGQKCIGCRRARVRRYKARKPEMKLKHWRLWVQRHPEENRARARKWTAEHPERARATKQLYFRANPDLFAMCRAKRRSLERSADRVTARSLDAIMVEQLGRCAYCGQPLTGSIHLDHRIPLARGGRHEETNLSWSCELCNRRKHTKTPSEFAVYLREVHDIG